MNLTEARSDRFMSSCIAAVAWRAMLLLAGLGFSAGAPTELRGDYDGTEKSIAGHRVPEWYEDAKFGMFIDWGVYSVAGYAVPQETKAMYPDWYLFRMYADESDPDSTRAYHAGKW